MKERAAPLSRLQGGVDPADARNARRPSWWDPPKPRQEPALPPATFTQSPVLPPGTAPSPSPKAARRQTGQMGRIQTPHVHKRLPASAHNCCPHGPALGQEQHLDEVDSSKSLLAERNAPKSLQSHLSSSTTAMRHHDQPPGFHADSLQKSQLGQGLAPYFEGFPLTRAI